MTYTKNKEFHVIFSKFLFEGLNRREIERGRKELGEFPIHHSCMKNGKENEVEVV